MQFMGTDLFQLNGKTYLIAVDHYSGFPFVAQLRSLNTASIINHLVRWFRTFGFPQVIRSDFGPQYRGQFNKFCSDNRIQHEVSSPYFPRSNGLAESGVKAMKHLLAKYRGCFDRFEDALTHIRTKQTDLRLMGRKVPIPDMVYIYKGATPHPNITPNRNPTRLPNLKVGQAVYVQDSQTKHWNVKATVKKTDGKDYVLEDHDGKILRRNRIFLRPRYA